MFIQRFQYVFLVIFTVLVLSSCSGGGDDAGSSGTPVGSGGIEGTLLDAKILGVTYTCDGMTHITDTEGKFLCQSYPIVFSIGPIEIGQITELGVDLFVLPQDLLGIARSNLDDATLLNLLIFLQSLDEDGDLSNGIEISQATRDALFEQDGTPVHIRELSGGEINLRLVGLGKNVVLVDSAVEHLSAVMQQYIDPCAAIGDREIVTVKNLREGVVIHYVEADSVTMSHGEPAHGYAMIDVRTHDSVAVTYYPDMGFMGTDQFDYTIGTCTKTMDVTVLEAFPQEEKRDFVAFSFKDAVNGCQFWKSDGTAVGTQMIKALDNVYLICDARQGQEDFLVNGRYLFNIYDYGHKVEKMYSISRDDIEHINYRMQGDNTITLPSDRNVQVHQDSVFLTSYDSSVPTPLVVKGYARDLIYYVAYSPSAINDPVNGFASGYLPWRATGHPPVTIEVPWAIPESSPSRSTGAGVVSSIFYPEGDIYNRWWTYWRNMFGQWGGTAENMMLLRTFTGDGVDGDYIRSEFVEMGDYVYYFVRYAYPNNTKLYLFKDEKLNDVPKEYFPGVEMEDSNVTTSVIAMTAFDKKLYIGIRDYISDVSGVYVSDGSAIAPHRIDSSNHHIVKKFFELDGTLYFTGSMEDNATNSIFKIEGEQITRVFSAPVEGGRTYQIRMSALAGNKLFFVMEQPRSNDRGLRVFDGKNNYYLEHNYPAGEHYIWSLKEINGKLFGAYGPQDELFMVDPDKIVFDRNVDRTVVIKEGDIVNERAGYMKYPLNANAILYRTGITDDGFNLLSNKVFKYDILADESTLLADESL